MFSAIKDPVENLALQYFDYLARCFPVMCASDEFHFLPRAEDASRYYDNLEDFDVNKIEATISELKEFQKMFDVLAGRENDLEKRIDLELLHANSAGILIEFENIRSWRHNPLLYLKIAFIGLDHALNKPAREAGERKDRTNARLNAIPRLLNQAVENMNGVPATYHRAARAMVDDCKRYLFEIGKDFSGSESGSLIKGLERTLSVLDAFDNFLYSVSQVPDQSFDAAPIASTLKDYFLSTRNLDEIFQIVAEQWWDNLKRLKNLQSTIDPKKSWQEIYHDYCPSDIGRVDTLTLYRKETKQICSFFGRHGFKVDDLYPLIELIETPAYLKSVRGSASFAAAFSRDLKEKSFFYITPQLPHQDRKEGGDLLMKRLHREYRFLVAHETIPGHHLLDSTRRRLKNPVRRQIESPLFYEGWATYTESLLAEYGYVNSPLEFLVDYKRNLWRSARCQIDIGIPTGKLVREDALDLLIRTGFSHEEAVRQINRFQLNPGYQLCYSLGRYEILKLKETWEGRMGNEQFHTFLLEGGELPFHLIEKRLEAQFN